MFRIGDTVEVDGGCDGNTAAGHLEEITVFGDFDADDPDFAPQPNSRPRSRCGLGASRNSSSSSLRRIASNNSLLQATAGSGRHFSGHLRQLSLDRLRSLSSPSGANCPGAVNAAVEDDGDEGLTDGGGGGDGGSPALAMAMGAAWRRAAPPDKAGCKSCGVLWSEGQFTLDCRECGGFAADRPCVDCDGHCGQVWRRDVPTSQLCGLATWHGRCSRLSSDSDLSSSGEGDGQSLPATSNVGDGDDGGDRGAVTMASSEDALADAVAIMLIH